MTVVRPAARLARFMIIHGKKSEHVGSGLHRVGGRSWARRRICSRRQGLRAISVLLFALFVLFVLFRLRGLQLGCAIHDRKMDFDEGLL